MKDKADKKTGNLLTAVSPGARRQAEYSARQRAAGRTQKAFWVTPDEAAAIVELINQLRAKQ